MTTEYKLDIQNNTPNKPIVAQFAKAPEVGKVKTRMRAVLSPQQCVDLHKRLVAKVFTTVAVADNYIHQLWVSSDHPFFHSLMDENKHTCRSSLHYQPSGDLDVRLTAALKEGEAQGRVAVVIGSDCITLTSNYIESALALLKQQPGLNTVIGPAFDGGFVLLAIKQWHEALFEGIEWGTERVLDQLIHNIELLGFKYSLLEPLHDIDRPEDLSLAESI
ncbi:TIGR04282 family arsenosugar biosynthesis glycosyltransferase [Saccharophagus degradans]|uniref:Glycosyltransferase n=1 Tax=Saccharophagus degradans (strain 2-40 / ATCC 43961 / DSM 17024) TaxID=203122 RepID=Q21IK0_SACD2|nr:TIGR04282 family arsenosugar biosynthesis glycosyltransferase [Saccharophagus degradans]ABD81479.1 conserved hypothetical protein [Saccharophagus degradans 2-40]